MYLQRVKNDSVWQSLKILYLGALLIFLINILFGFDNTFRVGDLPRWQSLIHLHSARVGWITLSAVGIAIWIVTGNREVSARYESRIRTLVWIAVIIFAAFVISFGLAYSRHSGFLVALLPLFGSIAVLILWVSAIFSFLQFKNQPVVMTVHFLIAGALLTAAIGATVGMIIFLVRYGWRAFTHLPRGRGVQSWVFFGTLWLIVYMGLFMFGIVGTGGDFSKLPAWYGAAFAHIGFAGMMTNLLFGVVASRGQKAADVLSWGEPAAFWLINLGIIVFIGLKIAADIRTGAALMGIGILLGVFVMFRRIQKS